MKNLIIFGTGKMAETIFFYFDRDTTYKVIGFAVDMGFKKSSTFLGLPVCVVDELNVLYPPGTTEIFIALGPSKMNLDRELKFDQLKNLGYSFAKYISPNSVCLSPIGENTFIGDMCVINPNVEIGSNNIFWEFVLVNEKAVIGSHCYFSPRATIGSFSKVCNNSIVGMGAIVKTSVVVNKKSLIGASCYISSDTAECGVYGEKSSVLYGQISEKVNISL